MTRGGDFTLGRFPWRQNDRRHRQIGRQYCRPHPRECYNRGSDSDVIVQILFSDVYLTPESEWVRPGWAGLGWAGLGRAEGWASSVVVSRLEAGQLAVYFVIRGFVLTLRARPLC